MQSSTIYAFLITPLGLTILFVALWCTVCFIISMVSGWFALARRFRKRSEPYGDLKSAGPFFYTVYLRFWGHYSSVVRLTAAADALYGSVLFLFRAGHPPLRIPWNEIQFGKTRRVWRTYIVLTLGNKEKIPLRIPVRMARNLGILDRFQAP